MLFLLCSLEWNTNPPPLLSHMCFTCCTGDLNVVSLNVKCLKVSTRKRRSVSSRKTITQVLVTRGIFQKTCSCCPWSYLSVLSLNVCHFASSFDVVFCAVGRLCSWRSLHLPAVCPFPISFTPVCRGWVLTSMVLEMLVFALVCSTMHALKLSLSIAGIFGELTFHLCADGFLPGPWCTP